MPHIDPIYYTRYMGTLLGRLCPAIRCKSSPPAAAAGFALLSGARRAAKVGGVLG